MNQSKRSSLGEESINIFKNNNTKQNLKGTLKVDKINYLPKSQGQKLFEDINIQYIEPLEGGEEESEEQDDGTYRRYLNNINKELNQKTENIVFTHDLGLNNNRLNVNDLFDKIKKKQKFKFRNSYLSVSMLNKKDDIINKEIKKKIIPIKRYFRFKDIKNLIVPKAELKKYIKIGKRTITYDNRKNINYYSFIKDILLNIRERKKSVRKIRSHKLFRISKKRKVKQNIEDDIFGNKKNYKIKDSFSLLDSSKKSSIVLIEEKKEEEKKETKVPPKVPKVEKKEEIINIEPPKEIINITHKIKKKKKKKTLVQKKKNLVNKNTIDFMYKSKFFQKKGTTTTIISNRFKPKTIQSKLKPPAINSILKDIKDLSQSILTNRTKNNNEKKNRTVLYDKHFGYEYWKENELRKCLYYYSNTNKKNKSLKIHFSPNKEPDTFSQMSSNFSWLFSKNNFEDMFDYETDFSFGNKNKSLNPYSIKWTKNMIQNNYNRKIKLKNSNNGIPKIELIRVQSSMPYANKEKIVFNKSKFDNEIYRKNNNMFGRIYKDNEVKFPVIKIF